MERIYSKYALSNDIIKGYEDYLYDLAEEEGDDNIFPFFRDVLYFTPIPIKGATKQEILDQVEGITTCVKFTNGFDGCYSSDLFKLILNTDSGIEKECTILNIINGENTELDSINDHCILEIKEVFDNGEMGGVPNSTGSFIIFNGYILGILANNESIPESLRFMREKMVNLQFDDDDQILKDAKIKTVVNTDNADDITIKLDLVGDILEVYPDADISEIPTVDDITGKAGEAIDVTTIFNNFPTIGDYAIDSFTVDKSELPDTVLDYETENYNTFLLWVYPDGTLHISSNLAGLKHYFISSHDVTLHAKWGVPGPA